MVVQHNLRAMNSNRMLGLTASTQSKSTEKLSSGYKINRAADDAAGLSISEKMRKQIRGLSQASLNAADGISAVQTAEGALNEVQDMLQRMNELAVKAANGTMSTDDRGYIQDEIEQLIDEIDRVSETTKFNETYLLKGDRTVPGDTKFQYGEAERISQDLYFIDDKGVVDKLEKGTFKDAVESDVTYYSDSNGAVAGITIASDKITDYVSSANVFKDGGKYYTKGSDSKYYEVKAGTELVSTNVYYSAKTAASGNFADSDMIAMSGSKINATGDSATHYVLKTNSTVYDPTTGNTLSSGTSIGSDSKVLSTYYSEKSAVMLDQADIVDYNSYLVKHAVQFLDADGNEVAANGLDKYLENDGTLKADAKLYLKNGSSVNALTEASPDLIKQYVNTEGKHEVGALKLKLHVGADATTNNQLSLDIDAMSASALGIESIRVDGKDDTNALNAIETIKEALNKVSDQRSALGAIQNRLEHTIANLDNVVENTTAAESQIRDTDMATEMVKYSNNNILAQAGQAMLAQANQSNQGVLSILG